MTEKDRSMKSRLRGYCNAKHRLVEILWCETDLTEEDVLSFAMRHSISIVKRL
jgi:hypothetical protein